MRRTTVLLLVWLAAPGGAWTQEAELTAAQQQLIGEADRLHQEAVQLLGQSRAVEATKHMRRVLELARQAYPADKYPRGHRYVAQRLNNVAYMLTASGEYAQAEELLRQALSMCQGLYPREKYPHGHLDVARALNNLGTALRLQGQLMRAEPLLREAVAMQRALYPKEKYPHGHVELAASITHLAWLLQGQGQQARAEPLLREAVAMRETLCPKDQQPHADPELALSYHNLATALMSLGSFGEAETLLRRSLAMNEALYPRERYPLGHTAPAADLEQLGTLLLDQNELARAEPVVRAAVAAYQQLYPRTQYPQGHPFVARSQRLLARLHHAKGELPQAEQAYAAALQLGQQLFAREKYPQGHPHLAACLDGLAAVLDRQGRSAQADRLLEQALAMQRALYPREHFPKGHPALAGTLSQLGDSLLLRGAYAEAETPLRQALAMSRALFPKERYPHGHPDLVAALQRLAWQRLQRRDDPEAEALLREALGDYAEHARYVAHGSTEAAALTVTTGRLSHMRDVFLSVTGRLADSDARTYATVWRARSVLTRVYQRRHLALIAAATDPAVRQAWDELQALRRQQGTLILAPAPTGPNDRDEQLRALGQEITARELSLIPRLPALKHDEDLAALGPEALRRLLPADAVLIDLVRYLRSEPDPADPGTRRAPRQLHYVAFVVSRDAVGRVELGRAEPIDTAVRQWREAIAALVPAGNGAARQDQEARLTRQAAALRQQVWEPLEQRLPPGAATVYLAPDGDLTQLPWAALPGKGKDRVLLDDRALAVLPHGPFLLEQLMPPPPRSAQRPPATAGMLLAGGIRYDEQPGPATVATRGAEPVVAPAVVWRYLAGTAAERQLLGQQLGQRGPPLAASLAGGTATTGRLRQELERCRYAHLATHGFFADASVRSLLQLDPKLFERTVFTDTGITAQRIGAGARNPLVLSGLVCSGANLKDTPERGILSADAIAGLLLDDLYLATLSACDTGIGDVAGGEGVFGLQRAFHIAGCKNVVASLWKVDDAATAALMIRLYGYLFPEDASKKLPPIEALRRAQLDLYRHPELIPAWARGEQRGPGRPRPATVPPPPGTPPELLTSEARAPIRLWAAFTLSGAGR